MASEVVHHVPLRAEALSAVLGALERPVVVMNSHMHRQIMPIVEGLAAGGDWADKICPQLVICEMGLQVAG